MIISGYRRGYHAFRQKKVYGVGRPSPWCRVWRIELEDKFAWMEALDLMPKFSVGGLSGSEPCVFVDDCACWGRSTARRGREVFVEKVGVVAGEFGVVMQDVDELATERLARGCRLDRKVRYALGCLSTDALQHFALPSQLLRVRLC